MWHGSRRPDQTFTFQTFLFFALTSLVSVRERRAFWRSRPSGVLAGSLIAAGIIGVVIGLHGVAELSPLPFAESALIFGYAAVCTLGANDAVKAFLSARVLRGPVAPKEATQTPAAKPVALGGSR